MKSHIRGDSCIESTWHVPSGSCHFCLVIMHLPGVPNFSTLHIQSGNTVLRHSGFPSLSWLFSVHQEAGLTCTNNSVTLQPEENPSRLKSKFKPICSVVNSNLGKSTLVFLMDECVQLAHTDFKSIKPGCLMETHSQQWA